MTRRELASANSFTNPAVVVNRTLFIPIHIDVKSPMRGCGARRFRAYSRPLGSYTPADLSANPSDVPAQHPRLRRFGMTGIGTPLHLIITA